jgi:hypothetical protein
MTGGSCIGISSGITQQIIQSIEEFSREPQPLVPAATAFDLALHEHIPARLDCKQRAWRHALNVGNGRADLAEHTFLVRFRQRGPHVRAQDTRQARDDEIGPAIALSFGDDLGNRNPDPSAELRERSPLG